MCIDTVSFIWYLEFECVGFIFDSIPFENASENVQNSNRLFPIISGECVNFYFVLSEPLDMTLSWLHVKYHKLT